jgi:hypothetical protein
MLSESPFRTDVEILMSSDKFPFSNTFENEFCRICRKNSTKFLLTFIFVSISSKKLCLTQSNAWSKSNEISRPFFFLNLFVFMLQADCWSDNTSGKMSSNLNFIILVSQFSNEIGLYDLIVSLWFLGEICKFLYDFFYKSFSNTKKSFFEYKKKCLPSTKTSCCRLYFILLW